MCHFWVIYFDIDAWLDQYILVVFTSVTGIWNLTIIF